MNAETAILLKKRTIGVVVGKGGGAFPMATSLEVVAGIVRIRGFEAKSGDKKARIVVEEGERIGAEGNDRESDMTSEEAVDEVGVGGDDRAALACAVENSGAHDDDVLYIIGNEPSVVGDVLQPIEVGGGVEGWAHGQRRVVFGVTLRGFGAVEGVVNFEF